MGTSRTLHILVVLGSALMILLIIVYWDDAAGVARLRLRPPGSPRPGAPPPRPRTPPHDSRTPPPPPSFLSDIDAFVNQFLEPGTGEPTDPAPSDTGNQSERGEERYVPRREWKIHLTPVRAELRERQERRRRLLREMCANDSLAFPGKNRSFDDIPNRELDHLIVDDRHGAIYCYVPKVACSNWKRIMMVLSERLLQDGAPQRDPMAVPPELVHNASLHFTFNKFWKRYGKFARHLMKVKLKKYTKFLFVRDPFRRLVSAYRNKFEERNEEFYRRFAQPMLRRYAGQPTPPDTAEEAAALGLRPSFSQFAEYLLDVRTEAESPFNEHWRQVYRLCHPCQVQYDFIGQLETAAEDAEQLLRLLRVDNVVAFPSANRTAAGGEEDAAAERLRTLTVDTQRRLYKLYEPDFKMFGYETPESLRHH